MDEGELGGEQPSPARQPGQRQGMQHGRAAPPPHPPPSKQSTLPARISSSGEGRAARNSRSTEASAGLVMSGNQQVQQQQQRPSSSQQQGQQGQSSGSSGQGSEEGQQQQKEDPHFARLASASSVLSNRISQDAKVEQATELSEVLNCQFFGTSWRDALQSIHADAFHRARPLSHPRLCSCLPIASASGDYVLPHNAAWQPFVKSRTINLPDALFEEYNREWED